MSILAPIYLKELSETGVSKYVNADPARVVAITNGNTTLTGNSFTLNFTDTHAINGVTKYDVWDGNNDLTNSVEAPATSIVVPDLPTDGRTLTLTLRPPAGYTADPFNPVTANFTAYTSVVTPPINTSLNALKNLFDGYIAVSRSKFDSWGSRYNGTSGGGYHAMSATDGLCQMYEKTAQTSYVQEAVAIAFNYINAGTDRTGNSVHTNAYYPLNGYKDWIWDKTDYLPGRINHYHQEWRAGAMVAFAMHAVKQQGGSGITPTNAFQTMYDFIAKHVWDKYSLSVYAPNTPPVIDSRNLENAVGLGQVARLCMIALIMDHYSPNKGNNRYHTYYNKKIPAMISEITARGGYPGQWTDPDNWWGTETIDVAHASDGFTAIALSERLGKNYVTNQFKTAVSNNIENNLYPPTDTDSVWTAESDGIYEGVWSSRQGRNWTGWINYVTPANIDRHFSDYLNNSPITGFGSEIEVGVIGNLYATKIRYST